MFGNSNSNSNTGIFNRVLVSIFGRERTVQPENQTSQPASFVQSSSRSSATAMPVNNNYDKFIETASQIKQYLPPNAKNGDFVHFMLGDKILVISKTQKGVTVQENLDYYSGRRSGLYIPDNPADSCQYKNKGVTSKDFSSALEFAESVLGVCKQNPPQPRYSEWPKKEVVKTAELKKHEDNARQQIRENIEEFIEYYRDRTSPFQKDVKVVSSFGERTCTCQMTLDGRGGRILSLDNKLNIIFPEETITFAGEPLEASFRNPAGLGNPSSHPHLIRLLSAACQPS